MTRLTPRLRWRQAVVAHAFPASQRPVKSTLLVLADLMSPTGDLHLWRDQLVGATGLPVRTLNRHLQRAVEDGWLTRETFGGHGRRSLYRTAIPESCGPSVARNPGSCEPSTRTQLVEVVGQPVAHSREESASDSERVALDRHRGRRRTPLGTGVSALDYLGKNGSNGGEWAATPSKRLSSVPRVGAA